MGENKDGQSWSSDNCYMLERQLVFSLCLDKLQGSRAPNLHRSVLLANTMRHIQREMIQEKEQPPGTLSSRHTSQTQEAMTLYALEPQLQPPDRIPTTWDLERGAVDLNYSRCAKEMKIEMDVSFLSSAFLMSSSSSPFVDRVFTDSSLIDLTSLLEAGNAQGYLTDLALDDIFEDIDTSMYDSSEASSIMTCVFCHMFGGVEETKVLQDCPSTSPLQCSPTDLNDLDNIMEVLVGLV